MTRVNAITAVLVVVLFAIHAVAGGFQLMGVLPGGQMWLQVLVWVLLVAICVHVVIGCILTYRTVKALSCSGASYWGANKLFWTRRISGLALLILVIIHVVTFMGHGDVAFRLNLFDTAQLVFALLLVACLAIHIIANIKPLGISLGSTVARKLSVDIIAIISILLLFGVAAFAIYFVRWSVF